jgi:2',3'-cyclic-nucleotide 2'-phosphodiesterase (5'-nucleotidase family)
LLDAGNALFKTSAPGDEQTRKRAEFILRSMGELGTSAMAVGSRDLAAGPEFLKKAAARARVQLLSANLADSNGKLLFTAATKLTVAGVRVGLFGISPVQDADGVRGRPPVQAALAEARKLRGKVDLVIALAAVPYADALQLSKEAGSAVDFILQSHESRGTGIPQGDGRNFVIPTGERGRQLGRLELDLSGSGRWVDAGQRARNEQLIKVLDVQIAEARKRFDSGSPEVKQSLSQTMQSFQARRDSLAKEGASLAKAPRSLKLDFLTLGSEYPDDQALKAQVAVLEPQPSAGEP